MLERIETKEILHPADLESSHPDLEVVGAFNPAAGEIGEVIFLVTRIAESVRETREGMIGLPRWSEDAELKIDWYSESEFAWQDPRVVNIKETGRVRLTFLSHLRIFRSRDGYRFEPVGSFWPEVPMGSYGVEDPRLTYIEDRFLMTYVAVSDHGVCTCLAETRDFREFERKGILFPPENKDVLLFPEKIGGKYFTLHRPNPRQRFSAPAIWLASSEDLLEWGHHVPLIGPGIEWESDRIGGGTPPVKTPEGWLTLYHGSNRFDKEEGVGRYQVGALLLDLEDPSKILGRTRLPIMGPEQDFEREGFVKNVVFPTATLIRGDEIWVYYGAADTSVGLVRYRLADLLASVAA
jgi:predicted GH43/DUF377 family glycosyl hydrolase